jgi:2-methylcitrate dehydratase PrpD
MLELGDVAAQRVTRILVRTPRATLQPLIHSRPTTGLEGKFSLEYALAATLLDGRPGLESFTDDAVARQAARDLVDRVHVVATPGGDSLLSRTTAIDVALDDGSLLHAELDLPPGAPTRPPSGADMEAKVADCAGDLAGEVTALGWSDAAAFLRDRVAPYSATRSASRG